MIGMGAERRSSSTGGVACKRQASSATAMSIWTALLRTNIGHGVAMVIPRWLHPHTYLGRGVRHRDDVDGLERKAAWRDEFASAAARKSYGNERRGKRA
jgi:hypothetical protein